MKKITEKQAENLKSLSPEELKQIIGGDAVATDNGGADLDNPDYD